MKLSNTQRATQVDEAVAAAMEAARALGRALGGSPVFQRFEAAYEAFQADGPARRKLQEFQSRQQELRMAAMWGGADPHQQEKLEREWQSISKMPSLAGYLRAQEELMALFRQVTGRISEEIGVDYGAACSPSGGCC
jgi:cell fate (sporulation/competence/biofilm development) regulator YlbF (YheA/YmcA/DUF963 family)